MSRGHTSQQCDDYTMGKPKGQQSLPIATRPYLVATRHSDRLASWGNGFYYM